MSLSFGLMLATGFLAGCAADEPASLPKEQSMAKSGVLAVAERTPVAEKPVAEVPIQTETDKNMLVTAQTACKSGGHQQFFDAFIQSAAVRRKYSASTIDIITRGPQNEIVSRDKVRADAYADFPLIMIDYYRRTAKPFRAGDDSEYVQLVTNQSSTNRISIEWARVHYKGISEGGDDLGTPVDLDGAPYDPAGFKDGQFLFHPTADCWELIEETRYQRK